MEKDICTLLQEIKAATGWSEPRMAAELGTSQPTVNRILNGQTECTSRNLKAIELLYRKVCTEALAKVNAEPRRRTTDPKR